MPSSKLSVRTATAKKPSICLSTPPIIVPIPWQNIARLLWNWTIGGYPPTVLVEDITPAQPPGLTEIWYWYNPSGSTPRIIDLTLKIPASGPYAWAWSRALDQLSAIREVKTSFPNPGYPPNSFSLYAWDWYSNPGDVVTFQNPAP